MKRTDLPRCIVCLAVLAWAAPAGAAALRVAHIFGDRMVLQREMPVRIWGWAKPAAEVTVRFAGRSAVCTADAKGAWLAELGPLKASAEGRELTVSAGGEKLVVRDVLVGEVWLCGGQSNMEYTLRASRDGDMEMACADDPALRFIRLPHVARSRPQEDFPVEAPTRPEGNWRLGTSGQADNCTAVGYYFARRLRRMLKVPVGLVDTSWGGTMAQHWVPVERLRPIEAMKPYFEKFAEQLRAWREGGGQAGAARRYAAAVKAWEAAAKAARARGERPPRRPDRRAYTDPSHKAQPGGMFNGMIAPLRRLAIRGVLFYQGENNSFTVGWKPFPQTFPQVIAGWREAFGRSDLPFGIIQIAGWSTRRTMTYDMNHHTNIVREVQFLTWRRTPKTGLIATYDTNTARGIHPPRKRPVGERAARWALATVYGVRRWGSNEPLTWRGPVYRSIEVADGKIIVSFEPPTAAGLRLARDDECGFYIAGADRQFHHARARVISDNRLEVWSEQVPKPVAVRYGWSNLPAGSLMNSRELPAYPFRSDDWPLVPHQSTGAYRVRAD